MNSNEKIFLVYAYEIGDYAYIGLTKDLVLRHRCHLDKKSNDTLYRFCNEYGYEVPEPRILENGLNVLEAQAKENDWIKFYEGNGWKILNIGETGVYKSSVGSYNSYSTSMRGFSGKECDKKKKILTYEECYNIALGYHNIKEFKIGDLKTYLYTKKMGWLPDYTWIGKIIPKKIICQNEITYKDYLEHAKECRTKTEFSLKYRAYYKWGLLNGYNDDVFVKEKKTAYKIPKEYISLTYDDIGRIINDISSRTEFYKKNQKLYNYCRYKGWLKKLFEKKESKISKKWEYNKVHKIELKNIDTTNFVEIPTFKNFYIDIEGGRIYKKLKKKINEVVPSVDEYGMKYYTIYKTNGDKKTYPYHKFLRIALNDSENNCVKYLDNNYSNTNLENLSFFKYDTENVKQIYHYYNNYIDKIGNVYNSVDEILNKCVTIFNGRKYIGEYSIDNLVYSKFIFNIKSDVNVEHLNGDLLNNDYRNLYVKKEIVCDIEIETNNEKYVIYLYDEIGKKHMIGTLWSDSVVKNVKKKLKEYLKKSEPVSEWIDDFKKNVYNELVKTDIKLYTDKIRTESSGCYWFESRKCWKSKISYNGVEKTLGYFKNFEQGKMLYEIAAIAIKYGYFDMWYKNIETERKIIKSLC